MKKIKDKIVEIVIGFFTIALLTWAVTYLRFIPELKDKFPIIQTTNDRQDECISDLQKTVEYLKEARKLDSVKKSTFQQMRSKPNIRLDELKNLKP